MKWWKKLKAWLNNLFNPLAKGTPFILPEEQRTKLEERELTREQNKSEPYDGMEP